MFIDTFLLYFEYFKCHNKMSAIFDSKIIVDFTMWNVIHKNDDIIVIKLQLLFKYILFNFQNNEFDVNINISSTWIDYVIVKNGATFIENKLSTFFYPLNHEKRILILWLMHVSQWWWIQHASHSSLWAIVGQLKYQFLIIVVCSWSYIIQSPLPYD